MSFASVDYLLFLPCVLLVYFGCPPRARPAVLLAASLLFYAATRIEFLLVMLASAAISYTGGVLIARAGPRWRGPALMAAVTATLMLLCYYKYLAFLVDNGNWLFRSVGAGQPFALIDVLLPIGISFHTFQGIAYCVDIYRGHIAPCGWLDYLLYISFFPQSVAGPIERPAALVPQLAQWHAFDYARAISGCELILWGLFKKVFVADRLGLYVDQVFSSVDRYSGVQLILAMYFFAFQIYADFSGYTDIARGSARILGIDLVENFDAPYLATSIRDFWRRWHMSLSRWFRDYVYIPLGGHDVAASQWVSIILVTFTLSGLWHGANWTFVLWGLFSGACLVVERILPWTPHGPAGRFLAWLMTFHLICIGWVLFRASSISEAVTFFHNMADLAPRSVIIDGGLLFSQLILALAGLSLVIAADIFRRSRYRLLPAFWPAPLRWASYYVLAYSILLLPGNASAKAFIYFQF